MAARAMVGFTYPNHLDLVVEGLDLALAGRVARVTVHHVARVTDSRPVDASVELFATDVTLAGTELMCPIDLPGPIPYAFEGELVSVQVEVKLAFPKAGWFSSENVLAETFVPLPQVQRGRVAEDQALMAPTDHYSFETSLASLSPEAKQRFVMIGGSYAVGLLGGFIALWAIGWTILFFVWLVGGLILGKVLYDRLWKELSSYAQLTWGFVPPVGPDSRLPVADLLDGLPRLDLPRARLRLVACNLERGQYKRGSGTDVRTVSFSEPVGAVVLYDETVDRWPQGTPLAEVFTGEVDFGPAFRQLAPVLSVGEDHGVGLRWEAQLIVPDLVDVELEGPEEVWMWPEPYEPAS